MVYKIKFYFIFTHDNFIVWRGREKLSMTKLECNCDTWDLLTFNIKCDFFKFQILEYN